MLIAKIIGITLLSIIGFILLILMLVLFVPIRYRMEASYQESFGACGKITWFLHIISLGFTYGVDGFTKYFRIFGFDLLNRKKRIRKNKEKKKKKEKPINRLPKESEYELEGFEEEVKTKTEEPAETIPDGGESASGQDQEEERGFFGKLKEYFGKIFDILLHFREKIEAAKNKILTMKTNADKYYALIESDHNRETLKKALSQMVIALRAIRPRKWVGQAKIGFEDPSTTGMILVFLSFLYPWIGPHMKIEPVYEQAVIEGDTMIRGRIFLITLLVVGFKLYFNKDLKKLLKSLK